MSCGKCAKRSNCKEICKEVEALLPRMSKGKMSKEVVISSDVIDRGFYKDEEGYLVNLRERDGRKQPIIED